MNWLSTKKPIKRHNILWKNVLFAAVLFFGWFIADSLASLLFSNPLDGIYYPAASGTLKNLPHDWSNKPLFGAPMYLSIFVLLWCFFIYREGVERGVRLSALTTAFTMSPFWVVSLVSADMYELPINPYWLVSMIYCNLSFFIFAFIGRGRIRDLDF